MDQLDNVSVVKKANVYYEGRVTSRTVLLSSGERKTLGIMLPGQYEFGTDCKEYMEILAGEVEVLLPDHEEWITFQAGQTFEIPAHVKFKITAKELTDYLCSYYE